MRQAAVDVGAPQALVEADAGGVALHQLAHRLGEQGRPGLGFVVEGVGGHGAGDIAIRGGRRESVLSAGHVTHAAQEPPAAAVRRAPRRARTAGAARARRSAEPAARPTAPAAAAGRSAAAERLRAHALRPAARQNARAGDAAAAAFDVCHAGAGAARGAGWCRRCWRWARWSAPTARRDWLARQAGAMLRRRRRHAAVAGDGVRAAAAAGAAARPRARRGSLLALGAAAGADGLVAAVVGRAGRRPAGGLRLLGVPLAGAALAGAAVGLAGPARAALAAGRRQRAAGRTAVAHPAALPVQRAEHRAGAGARRPGARRGRAGRPGAAVPRGAGRRRRVGRRWTRRSTWRSATWRSSRCASASACSVQLGPRRRASAAARVPPLVLQPLVENAVRHGVEPAVDGGRIRVQRRGAARPGGGAGQQHRRRRAPSRPATAWRCTTCASGCACCTTWPRSATCGATAGVFRARIVRAVVSQAVTGAPLTRAARRRRGAGAAAPAHAGGGLRRAAPREVVGEAGDADAGAGAAAAPRRCDAAAAGHPHARPATALQLAAALRALAAAAGGGLRHRACRACAAGLRAGRGRLPDQAGAARAPAGGAAARARSACAPRGAPAAAADDERRCWWSATAAACCALPLAEVLYLKAELKYVTLRTADAQLRARRPADRAGAAPGRALPARAPQCAGGASAVRALERRARRRRAARGPMREDWAVRVAPRRMAGRCRAASWRRCARR